MSTQITLKKFEEIYNKTYQNTLKYVILHCSNLEDVNDIIQDIYVELYNNLKRKKKIEIQEEQSYVVGIAKNILKKHYRKKYKEKNNISIYEQENEEMQIESDVDIEMQFLTKENVSDIWKYLNKKDVKIAKIFYLYYVLDMKIVEIAKEFSITESAAKNYIYRTIKELKSIEEKESDENAK